MEKRRWGSPFGSATRGRTSRVGGNSGEGRFWAESCRSHNPTVGRSERLRDRPREPAAKPWNRRQTPAPTTTNIVPEMDPKMDSKIDPKMDLKMVAKIDSQIDPKVGTTIDEQK